MASPGFNVAHGGHPLELTSTAKASSSEDRLSIARGRALTGKRSPIWVTLRN